MNLFNFKQLLYLFGMRFIPMLLGMDWEVFLLRLSSGGRSRVFVDTFHSPTANTKRDLSLKFPNSLPARLYQYGQVPFQAGGRPHTVLLVSNSPLMENYGNPPERTAFGTGGKIKTF
jgi:hypothetical protein